MEPVCLMRMEPTISGSAASGNHAVHLMLTEGEVRTMAENPERAMEEIHLRATKMSQVLEKILQESHGIPRWGINE